MRENKYLCNRCWSERWCRCQWGWGMAGILCIHGQYECWCKVRRRRASVPAGHRSLFSLQCRSILTQSDRRQHDRLRQSTLQCVQYRWRYSESDYVIGEWPLTDKADSSTLARHITSWCCVGCTSLPVTADCTYNLLLQHKRSTAATLLRVPLAHGAECRVTRAGFGSNYIMMTYVKDEAGWKSRTAIRRIPRCRRNVKSQLENE